MYVCTVSVCIYKTRRRGSQLQTILRPRTWHLRLRSRNHSERGATHPNGPSGLRTPKPHPTVPKRSSARGLAKAKTKLSSSSGAARVRGHAAGIPPLLEAWDPLPRVCALLHPWSAPLSTREPRMAFNLVGRIFLSCTSVKPAFRPGFSALRAPDRHPQRPSRREAGRGSKSSCRASRACPQGPKGPAGSALVAPVLFRTQRKTRTLQGLGLGRPPS